MKDFEFFTGHELRVEISRISLDFYNNRDREGCTIFCSIWNQSKKIVNVKRLSSFIINLESEQRNQDSYLPGYQFTEKSIEPGAMCTCGDIFFENRAGKIDVGWRYCIELQDETNSKKYKVLFKLDNMQTKEWEIVSCDITSSPLTTKMLSNKLKKSIERIEIFEEKLGIKVENVTISINDINDGISLFCDVYARNGDRLKDSITLSVTFYDEDNNILGTEGDWIDKDSFMGFKSCSIYYPVDDATEVKKIRLYPYKM